MCGGKSSRMREDAGIDKAFLDFYGEPLYYRQFEKLKKFFADVYVSVKEPNNYPKVDSDFLLEDAGYVQNIDTSDLFAPDVGMYSAFKKLKSEKIFFIGVDTPFVSYGSLKKISDVSVAEDANAHIARVGEKIHPVCGVYSKTVLPELESMILQNKHKLTLLLEKIGTIFVDLEDGSELANLNRYEDYEKAINNGVNPFR